MRLVFDTAMMVAAIRSDAGASRRLLLAALRGQLDILVSVPLMIEYEAVLSRPEHLNAAGLSSGDIDDLLDAVASVAEPVRLSFLWRPAVRDPNDDMVLETAANGRADASAFPGQTGSSGRQGTAPLQYVGACPDRKTGVHFCGTCSIVTFNVRDFENVATAFGIDVLSPAETLKRLGWKR